ncbi:MAG: hypothetical protein ACI9U2_003501 [Bradymonadia bacterium]
MYVIKHLIKSPSQFMDRYLDDGPAGGFFLPEKLGMAGLICLELHLEWLGEVYFPIARVERAGVVWENAGRRIRGAVVRLAEEEAPLRDALLETVRRFGEGYRDRKADRISARLGAHCVTANGSADGSLLDISASGAMIRTPTPLPTSTAIQVRFEDPARRVMRHVRAEVVRLDFSRSASGMGVRFCFQSRRERRSMARLVRMLATAPNGPAAAVEPDLATLGWLEPALAS